MLLKGVNRARCAARYELYTAEALWRLVGPRDVAAADVGANAAYFRSLLACRCTRQGAVVEPYRHIVTALAAQMSGGGRTRRPFGHLSQAVSDRERMACLRVLQDPRGLPQTGAWCESEIDPLVPCFTTHGADSLDAPVSCGSQPLRERGALCI